MESNIEGEATRDRRATPHFGRRVRAVTGTSSAFLFPPRLAAILCPRRNVRMLTSRASLIKSAFLNRAVDHLVRFSSTNAATTTISGTLPSPSNDTPSPSFASIIPQIRPTSKQASSSPPVSVNWRLRAPSRRPRTAHEQQTNFRSSYVKRISPQDHDLQRGEPFYDETRAYRARYDSKETQPPSLC